MSTPYYDYEEILVPIAVDYSRKFRKFGAEAQDIAQELRLWVFKHPEKIAAWEQLDDGADKLVARTLRNEAQRFCQQTKATYLGYSVDDLSFYSRGELKVLLDCIFDDQAWLEPPVSDDGGRSRRDPATGGNWIAMLADVARAYDSLAREDRELLACFHREHMTNVMLAELNGVTPQAMSARHQKALNRLLKQLGGERPHYTHDRPDCECGEIVGSRNAISNAAARAMTTNQYDED